MFMKIGFSALILSAVTVTQGEDIQRQLGAHVHGEGTVNLAQDGNRFELELELPGANIVGFEHAPRNSEQAAAIVQASDWLTESTHWLQADPSGDCAIVSTKVHTHGFDADDHDHHDGHHHHDHDHHDEHGHDHAEFHLTAALECARAGHLKWLELALFEQFPGNESLTVNIFTDGGQSQTRIGPANRRIMLP